MVNFVAVMDTEAFISEILIDHLHECQQITNINIKTLYLHSKNLCRYFLLSLYYEIHHLNTDLYSVRALLFSY